MAEVAEKKAPKTSKTKSPTAEKKSSKKSSSGAPKKSKKSSKKAPPPESDTEYTEDEETGELIPVGQVGDTANGLAKTAGNTLGGVANGALDKQKGGGEDEKQDTLRLRLDLNLDIEITLKARIHGDLELALLS